MEEKEIKMEAGGEEAGLNKVEGEWNREEN